MIKVTVLSDSHTLQDAIYVGKGDILIHCGDFTNAGGIDETMKFFDWFRTREYEHKIVIPGNHELSAEPGHKFNHVIEALIEDNKNDFHFLRDQSVEVMGLKIYGTPWVPKFFDWAFMKEDRDLVPYYDAIPENLDILITHGPAYGILDQSRNSHRGSISLLNAVKEKKPRVHCFGHIHHSYGISPALRDTLSINAAQLNDKYQFVNKPITFYL